MIALHERMPHGGIMVGAQWDTVDIGRAAARGLITLSKEGRLD